MGPTVDEAQARVENLAQRLRRLRTAKGMTLQELAKKVGVPPSTYKEWEYGRAVRGQFYPPLAQALEVSLSELVVGKCSRPSEIFERMQKIENEVRGLRKELELIF